MNYFDVETFLDDGNHRDFKEEFHSGQQILGYSEPKKGRQRVLMFSMSTLSKTLVNGKLDHAMGKQRCAASINFASGFMLADCDDGSYRYLHAQENKTNVVKLLYVCYLDDMINLREKTENQKMLKLAARNEPKLNGEY